MKLEHKAFLARVYNTVSVTIHAKFLEMDPFKALQLNFDSVILEVQVLNQNAVKVESAV
jgi:hypothetical protein